MAIMVVDAGRLEAGLRVAVTGFGAGVLAAFATLALCRLALRLPAVRRYVRRRRAPATSDRRVDWAAWLVVLGVVIVVAGFALAFWKLLAGRLP